MSEGYAKLIIGKAVDLATKAYLNDTPENLRELYTKAQGDILLNNNGTELKNHVNSLEEENLALKARIKELEKQQGTATSTTAKNEQRIDELYDMIKDLQKTKKD
jgi:exonuclease VII small subunit